ncbi:DVU0298 family protein [Berryella intestinalis]|uniref:DVU0298 family protein n=1 Tax=Berryella intestinalis TaxID=1531429 RepID=UPI00068DAE3E|nr:DVU0298 family protein [Berryella intestinalis]
MARITKDGVRVLVEHGDDQDVLRAFDEDPDRVRRYLTRLSYAPDDPIRERAVEAIRLLSQERSASMPEFFRETIRRHIWAMNEEGGNIDWSAPEIIGAIIAGNPEMFGGFFSFTYVAAVDEPTFQPSLVRAFDLVSDAAPDLVGQYAARIEELRGAFPH